MSFDFERYAPCGDWWDCIFEDSKAIAALMGWTIKDIGFSGFWSQGDGAHFVGFMGYAKGCAKAVKAYAPTDKELHAIADRWQALQRRYFYRIESSVKHRGHYSHENCTEFDISINRACDFPSEVTDETKDIARDFMRWIYRQLEREYEYQQAWILANAWQELQSDQMPELRQSARQLVRDMRNAIKQGLAAAPSICGALRAQLRDYLTQWEEARNERDAIADNFHYRQNGKSLSIAEFAKVNL